MTQGLSELGMFRLEKRRFRGCHQSVKVPEKGCKEDRPRLFSVVPIEAVGTN